MKIVIANDHAGFLMKQQVKEHLQQSGHEIEDIGTHTEDSVDYPDFAHHLADIVKKGDAELGILLCGSGNGVAMAANKHKEIRAALCWLPEIASLARQHNNANVLCIPARFVSETDGKKIVDAFLSAQFEGGRHERRVDKISR